MKDNIYICREFSETEELHSHSGIYPYRAVSERPSLNSRGEYSTPSISDDKTVDYARIAALGPERIFEEDIAEDLYNNQDDIHHHADIGWYTDLYTGYVADEEKRLKSSSGGLATALLCHLLETGEVTGVIHMKASSEGPLFQYGVSRTVEEVQSGSRTRYYPGSLFDVINEVRDTPGKYAVVGIPPFISELRRLENLEPVLKKRITVHVGLVCAHQKTANYASYLAWQSGIDPDRMTSIDFRTKVSGHPANEYCTTIYYNDDDGNHCEKLMAQSDLRGTNWGHGMFKSYFYDFSDDAFNETADIVFGDAWLPEFVSDYRGTNISIVRSQYISSILDSMRRSGKISLKNLSETDLLLSQKSLVRQTRREFQYRLRIFKKNGWAIPLRYRVIRSDGNLTVQRKLIQHLRGRISRASNQLFPLAREKHSLLLYDIPMFPLVFAYKIVDKFGRFTKKYFA